MAGRCASHWLLCLVAAVAWVPEARSATASQDKLQSLRSKFRAKVQKEQTDLFTGACKLLINIAKLEEGDQRVQTMETTGFACINDGDYKNCAVAFDNVARARNKLEASGRGDKSKPARGVEMLGRFCWQMAAGRVLDAMPWCRRALPILEPEFSKGDAWQMLQFQFYTANAELFDQREFPGLSINDKPPNSPSIYVPGLTPRSWHKSEWFPAAQALEENFARIAEEMDAFLTNPAAADEMKTVGRTSCRQDALLVQKGDWRDIGLYKKGVMDRRLCWKYFPHTCNIIEKEIPEVASSPWGIVSISKLWPASDTMKHTGNTNALLTMHLGIHTPKEAGMFVGKSKRQPAWERGKVTVFDDSFDHQVWHNGSPKTSVPRVVLLIRMWHPDFTLPERIEKVQTSSTVLPEWLKSRRFHLLNSTEADERWHRVSKQFRAGVGIEGAS